MKYINKKINKSNIEIVCLSDWHLGSKNFDFKQAKKLIQYINNKDNVFVIACGDLTNNALKTSKSDVYTSMNPKEEIDLLCSKEYLGSINKDKWLLFTSGNHGNRTVREVGLDVDEIISDKLGISDIYSKYLTVLNIQLKDNSYFISVHHGSSSGSTVGAKANVLNKLGNLVQGVDITIMGHTHSPMMFPKSQFILDKKHNKIINQITYMINAGSLQKYENDYAEEKMINPSFIGQAIISIEDSARRLPKKINCRWII